jgi:integrase
MGVMATRRRGTIRKRGKSFSIAFYQGDRANGKPQYYSETVKGTRADAERVLAEKLREHDLGRLASQPTLTLSEFYDEWHETSCKVRTSPRTAYDNRRIYDRYFRDAIGHKKLKDVAPIDVQRLYAAMQARGLCARTVHHANAILRVALNEAVRWEYIPRNPVLLVTLPRSERKERRVLTADEASRFIDECRNHKHGLIFEFAISTGCRPEEFLAVQWSDVDFERKTVKIERALVRHKGTWQLCQPKTSRSRRLIPLPDALVHQLLQHKQAQTFQRLKAANLWTDHDLIFTTTFGLPHSLPNLTYRVFRPILTAAGLPRIRVYDLRHSHATLLLAAEENPKVVAERLGHSTVLLTLDTYSHVLPTMQRAATAKLEKLLYSGNLARVTKDQFETAPSIAGVS